MTNENIIEAITNICNCCEEETIKITIPLLIQNFDNGKKEMLWFRDQMKDNIK